MSNAIPLTLIISIFTITGMILISSVIYYSEREERQKFALEYWLSNGAYFLVSILVVKSSPVLVALPTLMWVWRVSAIRKIIQSVTTINLYKEWHTYIFALAFTLSAISVGLKMSFVFYTFPQALAMFVVVMDCLWRAKAHIPQNRFSINHYLLFASIFLIITHSLDFPFVRFDPYFTNLGFGIVLLTNILMAIVLPAVTLYEVKKEQQHKLEELLKNQAKYSALGEMTCGIAHEMNNPLGIILHRANHLRNQVMKDNFEKDYLVRNLDHIEMTSQKMTSIIRSLKNFSTSKKSDPVETVSTKRIEDTLIFCQDRFRLNAIDLIVDDIPDHKIECRPEQISQVILNLLNNSFDAVVNLPVKWVRLSFSLQNDTFQIIVKDSGPGIPKNIRRKMMEPFFTTKTIAGTGLGLSIAMGIIEDHHGKLYYDDSSLHTTIKAELPYFQSTRYSQSS